MGKLKIKINIFNFVLINYICENFFNYLNFILYCDLINKNGDWGLGIGDWGLGIGDWAQSPIPNPQSPIPNPH